MNNHSAIEEFLKIVFSVCFMPGYIAKITALLVIGGFGKGIRCLGV